VFQQHSVLPEQQRQLVRWAGAVVWGLEPGGRQAAESHPQGLDVRCEGGGMTPVGGAAS